MSTEPAFARMAFPALRDSDRAAAEARGVAQGHAAGYAAGLRAAAAEIAERETRRDAELTTAVRAAEARTERALAALTAATRALDERALPLISEAEESIVTLAVQLAEALVGQELSVAEVAARLAVERVLAVAGPDSVRAVRLNPADLAALDENVRRRSRLTLVPDATIASGDAVADLDDGFLDARVSTAMSRVREALLLSVPASAATAAPAGLVSTSAFASSAPAGDATAARGAAS
jgi:flagellar assembly protein FliH